MPEPTAFYYRAEVKGIQDWILASDRLLEIKGGSQLIDGLADLAAALARQVQARLITCAAGNVELAVPTALGLERFARAWPLLVGQRAPGLTIIQAWATADEGWAPVFQRLGEARNRPDAVLPEVGPLVARAGRTGLPAVGRKDRELVDAAVRAKLDAVAAGNQEHIGLEALAPEGRSFVVDADKLGERYLAVVHADGNGLGQRFMALTDAAARQRASEKVSEACWHAAQDAVQQLAARCPAARGGHLRARPIVVAGDDFTFLVDAAQALEFTADYLRAFERHGQRLNPFGDDRPLTACAGVALVKTGFPFHAAHELAESLCKAAKGRLRALEKSGLLFHRITTASTDLAWDEIESRELSAVGPTEGSTAGARAVLSAGPYTVEELDMLHRLAEAMRKLPRGAIREWIGLSRESRSRAEALWGRTKEVASARRTWAPFDTALQRLAQARFQAPAQLGWADEPPAPGQAATARTPIADALLLTTRLPSPA